MELGNHGLCGDAYTSVDLARDETKASEFTSIALHSTPAQDRWECDHFAEALEETGEDLDIDQAMLLAQDLEETAMKQLSFRQAHVLTALYRRCGSTGCCIDTKGLDGRTVYGFVRRGLLEQTDRFLWFTEQGYEQLWLHGAME